MENELESVNGREKALQKFDKINADLAELESKYMIMVVQGPTDQDGFDMVHKARMDVKDRRVDFVKDAEAMRADAVRFQKWVVDQVKPIEARAKKIEAHLQDQEDIINNEKARIKAELYAIEAARIQSRRDRLAAMGVGFNGQMWAFKDINLPDAMVRACNDEQFGMFVAKIQEAIAVEDARLQVEEATRKAESARIAKIAAEQEAERVRLAEVARKQEEEGARVKAELEKVEKEKQRLIDEENKRLMEIADAQRREVEAKQRAEELEKARKEAAEKAIRDAEEKRLKDEADRIEKERLAKIAADKKAARAPDKEKIFKYLAGVVAVSIPNMKTDEGAAVLEYALGSIGSIVKAVSDKAKSL
jgi:phage-related minor tail protein